MIQAPFATLLWTQSAGEAELAEIASRVAKEFDDRNPFCLWLRGDLGAGKTAFAQAFLHELGLPSSTPVLSPTYTYMVEYEIFSRAVFHMDLYRLIEGDDDSLISLLQGRSPWGLVVEWPERCAASSLIAASHILDISFEGARKRQYTLMTQRSTPPSLFLG